MGVCAPHTQRRPGERRDPYAVPYRLGALSKTFRPTNAGGYGSLLSQGRRWGKRNDISAVIASAAKQSIVQQKERKNGLLRCARNDVDMVPDTTSSPRREAPEVCISLPPKEGVGNAGRTMHPRSRVHLVVVKSTRVTTSTPKSPGIPARNGFNGFLRALPGDRALLPPSPCGLKGFVQPG